MEHAIPFDTVEQLLWSTGFRNMLESGTLYIDNMQDKIDLGLEPQGTTEPTNYKVLNNSQMLTLLKIRTPEEFEKEIKTYPIEQINILIQYAVANEIAEPQKVAILKEITGKDIVKLIARKHEMAEADKIQKEKEAAYAREDGRRV